ASVFTLGPVTLLTGGGADTLKGGLNNDEFRMDVSNLTAGQKVAIFPGTSTNDRIVILGASTIDSAVLARVDWHGAGLAPQISFSASDLVVSTDIIAPGQNL